MAVRRAPSSLQTLVKSAQQDAAGDDEESWALGLTPDQFWRNRNFILNEGPMRCVERVDDVVSRASVSLAKEKRAEDAALIAESLRSPLQSPSSSSSSPYLVVVSDSDRSFLRL